MFQSARAHVCVCVCVRVQERDDSYIYAIYKYLPISSILKLVTLSKVVIIKRIHTIICNHSFIIETTKVIFMTFGRVKRF